MSKATTIVLAVGLVVVGFATRVVLSRVRRRLERTVEQLRRVAAGTIAHDPVDEGADELGALGNATVQLVETLEGLTAETTAILQSAQRGDLSRRGRCDGFHGVYRALMSSVNDVLDHLQESSVEVRSEHDKAGRFVAEMSRVLDRVAAGELSARVDGEYSGHHQQARDALNRLIESLAATMSEVERSAGVVQSAGSAIAESVRASETRAELQRVSVSQVAKRLLSLGESVRSNVAIVRDVAKLSTAAARTAAAVWRRSASWCPPSSA